MKKLNANQHGQVILFVVVAMVIALGLGVAVSARTLGSLSQVADTDTSSRVLAAAEGGAESILKSSYAQLDTLITTNACSTYPSVAPECQFEYDYPTTDGSTTKVKAIVTVNPYMPRDYRVGSIEQGAVKQINLKGYSEDKVKFCWSYDTSAPDVDVFFVGIKDNGSTYDIRKGFISVSNNAPVSNSSTFSIYNPTTGNSEYSRCQELSNLNGLDLLRVWPINGKITKAMFSGLNSDLPQQGYLIKSTGEFEQKNQKITRSVQVTKSFPYAASSIFDYAIYAHEGDVSN